MTSLKLVADTPLRQLTLNLTLTLRYPNPIPKPNSAQLATGNKRTTNGVSCLKMSLISYVLNADGGRYTDTPVH